MAIETEEIIARYVAETDVASFEKTTNYARDNAKKLEKEMVIKLQLDVLAIQGQIKSTKDALKTATGNNKINLELNLDTLKSNLTEAKRQLQNYRNTGDKELSRLQSKFDQVTGGAGKLGEFLGQIGITAGIYKAGEAVITLAGNLQQARIAFSTMLGSANDAEVLLKDLSEFAKATPFELTGLREQSKLLLAYGFSADEIIPTLTSLGNISAGVGIDKLPRLTYALGQVKAAGKLTGQDFRQFTETGVSLGNELSKITGIANINSSNVSDLGITYEQVLQALNNLGTGTGKFS